MSNETIIRRLMEKEILTQEQGEELMESLAPRNNTIIEQVSQAKKVPLIYIMFTVIALLLLCWGLLSSHDPRITADNIQNISQTLNQGEVGEMNSTFSVILAIIVFAIAPIIIFVWLNNGLVSKEEEVHKAWAQVESNYQRRSDLIPPLIEVVSRYLKQESDTMIGVTAARSGEVEKLRDSINALISTQNEASAIMKEAQGKAPTQDEHLLSLSDAQNRLGTQMHKLIATVEAYPDLKSSEQMLQLQAQLEGTENRINMTRMAFNDAVSQYNSAIRTQPASLVASIGHFKRKAYFKSESGAEIAPKTSFK